MPTSAIFSLLGLETSDVDLDWNSSITLHGTVDWVREFIQVYNSDRGWCTAQSSAYVRTKSKCAGYVYDDTISDYVWVDGNEEIHTHYSPKYFNKEQRKQDAVLAYLRYDLDYDCTGDVQFRHYGNILLTFYEPFGMQSYFPPD